MGSNVIFSTLSKVLDWAQSQALDFVPVGACGCLTEVTETIGCRYDVERFGAVPQVDPAQADLLIVCGYVSYKLAPHLRAVYDSMRSPKYVISIGACANCGGKFAPEFSYAVVPGADRIVPVDVYVPGCPPRPEAIMNGLIALQEKIRGNERNHLKT
jgi:NADH-quinone oxidoreductase subunit B